MATGENDKYCCCKDLEDCCWHKCPLGAQKENWEKIGKCGMEKYKWAYAALPKNGEGHTFVAQAGILSSLYPNAL